MTQAFRAIKAGRESVVFRELLAHKVHRVLLVQRVMQAHRACKDLKEMTVPMVLKEIRVTKAGRVLAYRAHKVFLVLMVFRGRRVIKVTKETKVPREHRVHKETKVGKAA